MPEEEHERRPRAQRAPGAVTAAAIVAILWLLLTGCAPASDASGANPPEVPVATVPGSVPRPDHVLVVVFENKGYDQVVGKAAAPYLTSLAREGANFTDAHGENHPSQPNYIALLSGSTHGVTDDSCPQDLGAGPTLASQLLESQRGFAGFSEAQPAPGFAGCTTPDGLYARKHNPWVDFSSVPVTANLPMSQFPRDLSALPTVAVAIPNMCNDMHDCPVRTGDAWARDHLSFYLAWVKTHNSLLVVTFDEDGNTGTNHIPTIMVGPMVRPGDIAGRIDHYTLLRTLEDMYELPALGTAASRSPVTGIWTG